MHRRRSNSQKHGDTSNELRRCYNCQKLGHLASECRGQTVCRFCYRTGHSSSECREKEKHKAAQKPDGRTARNKNNQKTKGNESKRKGQHDNPEAKKEQRCARCKSTEHRVQDCPHQKERNELQAPAKKYLPRQAKDPPQLPGDHKWPVEEEKLIRRLAILFELAIDSRVQKSRHDFFIATKQPIPRKVVFHSRVTSQDIDVPLEPDRSKIIEHQELSVAWNNELLTIQKEIKNTEEQLFTLIEKSVLTAEAGWKIATHGGSDAFNRIASDRKNKFMSNVQEFADLRLGLLIEWVNYFLSTGAEIGKAAVNDEKRKMEVREADRIARINKRLVQAAAINAVGPTPPTPLGMGYKAPPSANMSKFVQTPPNPPPNSINKVSTTPQRGSQAPGGGTVVPPINIALVAASSGPSSPRSTRQLITDEIAKARSVGDIRTEEELLRRLSDLNKRSSASDTLPHEGIDDENTLKSPRHTK